jgi:hypothetical protein
MEYEQRANGRTGLGIQIDGAHLHAAGIEVIWTSFTIILLKEISSAPRLFPRNRQPAYYWLHPENPASADFTARATASTLHPVRSTGD